MGGYYLFSKMQGRPFNGIQEDLFMQTLVALILDSPAAADRVGVGADDGAA